MVTSRPEPKRPTSDLELAHEIRQLKIKHGKDLCILAHLYQRKAIAELANFVGDSYGLSRSASQFEGGRTIVFCGVRFMAESAAILCRNDQAVLHPDPEAGCPMAEMAPLSEVSRAWETLSTYGSFTPITYMNSTVDIKAFCGAREGIVCTSSNAREAFGWAFAKSQKMFFLPDEHLGRNTAIKYGIAPDEIAVWDPEESGGGEPENYGNAKVVLWRGYCPVHQKFTVRDIEHVRQFYPGCVVLVHPECPSEVVENADAVGSTDFIRKFITTTKPGDKIFVGTEINLIQNLQAQYPDRLIAKLHRSLCLTMYQITLEKLHFTLKHIDTVERVAIPPATAHFARVALDRMLALRS